ncbi:MAG: secondary thiamine-phosphate synthase enzyme YjbQ [Desulfurococcaceae archaeon]
MKIVHNVLKLSSTERFQLIDVTAMIEDLVERSGVKNGIVLVYTPHATACLVVNEHEKGLMEDILNKVKEFTEPGSVKWKHNAIDDNAHAHIASALFGTDRVFPIINGKLVRGTWQNIFLVEMDGPRRNRELIVIIMGE